MRFSRVSPTEVIARIDRPESVPVLVVQCSAGAGAALRRSLEVRRGERRREGALLSWLTLTAQDNEAAVFTDHLALALQAPCPKEPAGNGQAMARLVTLLNRLAGEGGHRTLLLDRYEVLTGAAVQNLMRYLLDYLPQSMRVVIITEGALPPGLPRLLVRAEAELFSCVQ